MISSPRDDNRVVALLVTRSDDGVSPMTPWIVPSTHHLLMQNGTTGSGASSVNAERDANRDPVLLAVSSEDGTTPVEVWGDFESGAILIQST